MVDGSHQRLKLLPEINLRLDNTSIAKVDTYKYLGVVLDSNISWSAHTDYTCRKASSRIGLLKRTKPFISTSTAKLIYSAIIEPVFDYCGVVWDECGATATNKLQRLQNRAARVILETDTTTPSSAALDKLGMSPLHQRRQRHKAIIMFKCLNNETEGIDKGYMRHMDRHCYNTRRKYDFILPKPKTNYLKRSFKYSAIKLWNSLPSGCRESKSVKSFKKDINQINF